MLRLPPNQILTKKWPILHEGAVPDYGDLKDWRFRIFGEVENEVALTYEEIMQLPKTISTVDMHCVTHWSKYDTTFEGIAFKDLLHLVKPHPHVKYALIYGHIFGDDFGYSANLPIEALMGTDALFVYRYKDDEHEWQDLTPKHGFPLRFIPPKEFYLWKGSKWSCGIQLLTENEPGYWEARGYHLDGNPWREERFAKNDEKPSGYGGEEEWTHQEEE